MSGFSPQEALIVPPLCVKFGLCSLQTHAQKSQAALPCHLGRTLVVSPPLVAIKAMCGRVFIHHRFVAIALAQCCDAIEWRGGIVVSKVRQHRGHRLVCQFALAHHATAVIANRRPQALGMLRGTPSIQAAPAKAHHADFVHPFMVVSPIDAGLYVAGNYSF